MKAELASQEWETRRGEGLPASALQDSAGGTTGHRGCPLGDRQEAVAPAAFQLS